MRSFSVRALRTAALPLALVSGLVTAAAPSQQRVNPLAATLDEFSDHVKDYLKVRKAVEAKIGTLPKTSEPAVITEREHALGVAIRKARSGAKEGDIFTEDVASVFRKLIADDLANRRPVDRHAFVVEQPDVAVHVNDFYPTSIPLATVPPALLKALPVLPDGLEYRFAGRSLILRDVDPNLVVDVLSDAIPRQYGQRHQPQDRTP